MVFSSPLVSTGGFADFVASMVVSTSIALGGPLHGFFVLCRSLVAGGRDRPRARGGALEGGVVLLQFGKL
eukprot:4396511-Pyramimonas_sp.AAC.1